MITRITAGGRMVKMNKLMAFWKEVEPVVEFGFYLTMAFVMKIVFADLSSLQAILLVYGYFIMSLMRIYIEKNR